MLPFRVTVSQQQYGQSVASGRFDLEARKLGGSIPYHACWKTVRDRQVPESGEAPSVAQGFEQGLTSVGVEQDA